VKGNIRAALDELDAQPYEALYVSFDPRELQEAIPTRIGTMLVGQISLDPMPDYLANDLEEVIQVLSACQRGYPCGWTAEVYGSVEHGTQPPARTFFVYTTHI
jgi:hypothetical protein